MKFEYRISLIYLIIGALWILFSDLAVNELVDSPALQNELQTYKGWFYVVATGALFFVFLRRHLGRLRTVEQSLESHQKSLEKTVQEKTRDLDQTLQALNEKHEKLQEKNEIIHNQNLQLQKALEDLKSAQSKLMQAEKMASIGLLTRGLAHEVNNPLNYISGGLVGLEDQKLAEHNEETQIYIRGIREGLQRVHRIIRSLNQMSNQGGEKKELCDIGRILDNVLVLLLPEYSTEIQIQNSIKAKEIQVVGNRAELYQVFFNIIQNAFQAMPDGGVLKLNAENLEAGIRVQIQDSGSGIATENLLKVTDPFFTTRSPGEGVGLGLSIAYNIIDQHKGKMSIQSQEGQGTTVTVEIPNS
ncbi:sensor histidine kinase [Croceimicrobium hydrocarbonivorans]|uniref:histidine kinase n=1 Tax=Croceimicrobium hydrocarbonivorans TaxID=2761580 RepID=A0A7H0VD02_9FLAO|nr:ATP-binding protein [Croceimicrobium hydrocarbonivorans]QNR23600.1 hypothetical protein H4K34_14625 [Croceimicrobium hydrocarbonivorans]